MLEVGWWGSLRDLSKNILKQRWVKVKAVRRGGGGGGFESVTILPPPRKILIIHYDTLSTDGYVIVLGDFNGDIGNPLGEKVKKEPNQRGLKLTEFANFFNPCPVNLLKSCIGPMETYYSHCGRYRSTLDYIFLPSYLLDNILMVKTFDLEIDNTLDHVPIQLNVSYSSRLLNEQDNQSIDSHGFNQKVHWSRFSQEEINGKFVALFLTSLASVDHGDLNDVSRSTDKITKPMVDCSLPLVTPRVNRRRHGNGRYMLNCQMMSRLLVFVPKMLLIHGNAMNFPIQVLSMIIIARSVGTVGDFYANF